MEDIGEVTNKDPLSDFLEGVRIVKEQQEPPMVVGPGMAQLMQKLLGAEVVTWSADKEKS